MLFLWEAQKHCLCSKLRKETRVQNTGQESECVLQKMVKSSSSLAQEVDPFFPDTECKISLPQAWAK